MNLNWEFMISDIPTVLSGLWVTLGLTAVSYLGAILIGILFGLILLKKVPVLYQIVLVVNTVLKGLPLILQLLFCYYAIPQICKTLAATFAFEYDPRNQNYFLFAAIALSANFGAYMTDLVVSSYKAIDKGQTEAALAAGMSKLQGILYVVGPQALVIALPGLSNYFMWLLKATCLASVVNVFEMTSIARASTAVNYAILEGYLVAAGVYWIVCVVVERLLNGTNELIQNRTGKEKSYA